MIPGERPIRQIIKEYHLSFASKEYGEENDYHDVLMDVFGLTPLLKRENRQYWGRELRMCWQLIVTELFKATTSEFQPGLREGADELCDLIARKEAIDTKYSIGSGDSGTLKKFKQYGKKLLDRGFIPVLLIVREDNLAAAMTACTTAGWKVYTGDATFKHIEEATGVSLPDWFKSLREEYHVRR